MHLPAPLLEGLARNSSWRRLLPLFRLLRLVCDPDLGSPPPSGTSSAFLLDFIIVTQRVCSSVHLYFTKIIHYLFLLLDVYIYIKGNNYSLYKYGVCKFIFEVFTLHFLDFSSTVDGIHLKKILVKHRSKDRIKVL